MPKFGDWSGGAKALTGSMVCLLLAIGFCANGAPWEGPATWLQNFASISGLVLLGTSLLLFLASLVMFVVAWADKPSRRDRSRRGR